MISHGRKIANANLDALVQQRTSLVNQQLRSTLMKVLGAGAGVGLVARGTQGLYNIGRRALAPPPTLGPKAIEVPVPAEEEKQAGIGDFLTGSSATSVAGHPLLHVGGAAAFGAGALGSWHAADYILDQQRKKQMKGELDKAKQEYEQALLSAYDKKASALGQDLDRLFELVEKQAGVSDYLPDGDTAGKAVGWGLLPAAGLALASGLMVHNMTAKRRQSALLRKAMAQRRRQTRLAQPTRLYVSPQAVSPLASNNSMNTAAGEDELNGEPLDQEAA